MVAIHDVVQPLSNRGPPGCGYMLPRASAMQGLQVVAPRASFLRVHDACAAYMGGGYSGGKGSFLDLLHSPHCQWQTTMAPHWQTTLAAIVAAPPLAPVETRAMVM